MATCHLVTHANLALLGNVYLCHLDDARWKLITDSEGKLPAVELSGEYLVLLEIVYDKLTDKTVDMFVICPS